MPKQKTNSLTRRGFVSASAKGIVGATAVAMVLPNDLDAEPTGPTPLQRTSVPITGYSVEWNPRANKGRVFLLLKNGRKYTLNIASLNEAAGYAAILSQRPVVLWSDNSIGAPWQETGKEEQLG